MNFAMDLVTETVALIQVSEKDMKEKLKGMPCIVTSYKVINYGIQFEAYLYIISISY